MKIRKAFVFAAGFGERLLPLTEKNPKPLLPVGQKPMLDLVLFYLKRFGVESVVINTHYLAEKIEKHVGNGKKYGLHADFSREPMLLGTGGGLKKAEKFFKGEEAFFTLNSDTLINCDLAELADFHAANGLPATLVAAPWQEGYTRLQIGGGRLLNVGVGDHLFTGLTLLTPRIFEVLEERECNLVTDGILPLMEQVKGIGAFEHHGYWRDIGSMKSYEAAQEEWAAGHHPRVS